MKELIFRADFSTERLGLDFPNGLFQKFKTTKRFRAICEHFKPPFFYSLQESSEIRASLAGVLFHYMAYFYLDWVKSEGLRLLSPEETLELYQRLYPERRQVLRPVGFSGLSGITVPDGLLIKESGRNNQITAVCHYTSAPDRPGKIRNSGTVLEDGAIGFKMDRRAFPKIFAESALLFVIPRKGNIEDVESETWFERVQPLILEMPFTNRELRGYIDETIITIFRPVF